MIQISGIKIRVGGLGLEVKMSAVFVRTIQMLNWLWSMHYSVLCRLLLRSGVQQMKIWFWWCLQKTVVCFVIGFNKVCKKWTCSNDEIEFVFNAIDLQKFKLIIVGLTCFDFMIVVEKYSVQCYSLQFSNGQLMCTFIWNNWNPFNSWSFVYHFVMRWHEQKKGSDVKRTNFMNIMNSYECVH